MNLKGKVVQVLPVQSGQSQNGEWKKQEFIIETEGQYPKKVCVSLWGDKVDSIGNGSVVSVDLNAESREHNGRWYTELRVWKVDIIGQGQPNTHQQSQGQASAASKEGDSMPF